ncbi:MAG: hypothetical protein HY902_20545 [Deltaproteobacteria bacterium]|nr:hypothetical protein [Deltaproteobacteria bacterium]
MAVYVTAPVGDVINDNLFIVARVEADERVASHADVIQVPHDGLMKAVAARNVAANSYQKAVALRAAARIKFELAVVAYGLKVAAHYEGRTADGYLRLFPKAPSNFATLSERDLPLAVGELAARIGDPKTDKELAKLGVPVVAAAKAYQSAADTARTADVALTEAQKSVQKAKHACLEAHSKLRGLLTAAFPRHSKLVASFFPITKKKAKTAEVPQTATGTTGSDGPA